MYDIYLLGPLVVECGGQAVLGIRSRKAIGLLAYVASKSGAVLRSQLAELFWPGQPEARSHANLRWVLNHLTAHLPDCLAVDRHNVAWGHSLHCDVHVFTHFLQQNTIADYALAAGLYRGEFLAGFLLHDCPEWELWLASVRERWFQQINHVFSTLIRFYSEQKDYHTGVTWASRWVDLAPWQEEAHQHLIRLLAASGQERTALAQYATCRRLLADELGVEPSAETKALYLQIRTGTFDKVTERQGDKVSQSHERLATLSPSHPLTPSLPHNLPRQLTPFVGREKEIAEIQERLTCAECTWLTLLGPGGIGKTRLALAAAGHLLPSFPDGVWFVALAGVVDDATALLPATIAQALPLALSTADDAAQQLLNWLRPRRLLLVLDNFEHLRAGVELLGEIILQAPGVKLLLTSRERLKHQAEWLYDVKGLACPPMTIDGSFANYSAVQLFFQNARRIQATFQLTGEDASHVARICRAVDGMPLGIELAASWVRDLACATIADHFGNGLGLASAAPHGLPPRHHTLTAVIDSSWQRLTPGEQNILARLTVFRGGFRLPAVKKVTGAYRQTASVLLTNFVDKSLLATDSTGWYSWHELVRQYGQERLQASGELAAVQAAHGRYYAAFVAQQGNALITRKPQAVLAGFDLELDNVRAAWQWAVRTHNAAVIDQAASGLSLYYDYRSLLHEARLSFQQAAVALAQAEPSRETAIARAKALSYYGLYLFRHDEFEQAEQALLESLALATQHDSAGEISYALYVLGYSASAQGQTATAETYLCHALDMAEARPDGLLVIKVLYALGRHYCIQQRHPEGFAALRRALEIARTLGDGRSEAHILSYLGVGSVFAGDALQAQQYYEESLRLFQTLEMAWGIAQTLSGLIDVAYRLGRYDEARQRCEAALEIYNQMGGHAGMRADVERIYRLVYNPS